MLGGGVGGLTVVDGVSTDTSGLAVIGSPQPASQNAHCNRPNVTPRPGGGAADVPPTYRPPPAAHEPLRLRKQSAKVSPLLASGGPGEAGG